MKCLARLPSDYSAQEECLRLCLPFLRSFANTGRRIYLNIRLKSRVESLRELLLLFLVLVCRRSGPELVFVKESIHRGAKPVCLSFSNSWKIQTILSNLSIDRHASLHLLYLLSYILFCFIYYTQAHSFDFYQNTSFTLRLLQVIFLGHVIKIHKILRRLKIYINNCIQQ